MFLDYLLQQNLIILYMVLTSRIFFFFFKINYPFKKCYLSSQEYCVIILLYGILCDYLK